MTYFRKKICLTFGPHPQGSECACGQNICYHVNACVVRFNLICNMTIFQKSSNLALAPPSKSTPEDWSQAFRLKSCLIWFISTAPLPASKISAKNIDIQTTALVIAKFKYLTLGGVKGVGSNFDIVMLIYRHWAIMVYSEKLLNKIAFRECEDHYTKKLI